MSADAAAPPGRGAPLVVVDGLVRRFGDVTAVEGVSFTIRPGEILGFIGPNGAGKTTTMRILAGLDVPHEGHCEVAGISSADDPEQVARVLGFMPDHYGTYPNMTVAEYLDFFARAHGLAGTEAHEAVESTLGFCQLDGLRDKRVTTLSKGMKQRLCLGRCLVHDPPVLVLDEPMAGLDPRARVEFRELLRVVADGGKAVLVSSHILADLEELSDSVAIVEKGRMVTAGAVDAIRAEVAERREGRAAEGDRVLVTVRLAVPVAGSLARTLAEDPDVRDARVHAGGREAVISVPAAATAQAAVLARLIGAGLPVASFAPRAHNLEDAFMVLTEGKVQ